MYPQKGSEVSDEPPAPLDHLSCPCPLSVPDPLAGLEGPLYQLIVLEEGVVMEGGQSAVE